MSIVDDYSPIISKIHEFLPKVNRLIEKKRPTNVLSIERNLKLNDLSILYDPNAQHISKSFLKPPLVLDISSFVKSSEKLKKQRMTTPSLN